MPDTVCSLPLDFGLLEQQLTERVNAKFAFKLFASHPYLLAAAGVSLSNAQQIQMQEVISAVESVIALTAYQNQVLRWAPELAQVPMGPLGVFMGYDFHMTPQGPQLIEINSNAGGAMLNAVLCAAFNLQLSGLQTIHRDVNFDALFLDMFRQEFAHQRGDQPLESIAIVDSEPPLQYLYSEFVLFAESFMRLGVPTFVVDPSELTLHNDQLFFKQQRIDLVYNRLTDFTLADPKHAALREAYLRKAVVLTPNPRVHALYADKRNLTVLGNDELLKEWGVPETTRQILTRGILETRQVSLQQAEFFWNSRAQWFFKPFGGFGGKAVYRGKRVTRGVFNTIVSGGYLAQRYCPANECALQHIENNSMFKIDWRNYVYAGRVQLIAARLYQGQVTNFRTPGGGYAPAYALDSRALER